MRLTLFVSVLANFVLLAVVFVQWGVAPAPVVLMNDYESDLEQQASVHRLTPISDSDIVFAGDDFLARGPWGDVFRHYTIYLRDRAIGGETCPQLRTRLESWTAGRPAPSYGRVLVLSCGANDILAGVEERQSLLAMSGLLDHVARVSPSTRVVVLGVALDTALDREALISLNADLGDTVTARNMVFLNVADLMQPAGTQLPLAFRTSNGRPNGEAYRLVAEKLAPYLRP